MAADGLDPYWARYQGAILRGHEVLLIQHREHASGRRYWLLPGGGREPGESEEACVQREMREETSLEVAVERLLLDLPSPDAVYQRRKTYLCSIRGGRAAPGYEPEADAQAIYAITDVQWLDLRSPSTWEALIVSDHLTYPQLLRLRDVLGYSTASEEPTLVMPLELRTPRLVLRRPRAEDAATIFQTYAQDPDVCRFMTWRPHESLEETRQFVQRCLQAWVEGTAWSWALTRVDQDVLLGMVELRLDGHRAEMGYVLTRAEWGKGYMTEAVQVIVDLALAVPQVYRIAAVCDVGNGASARVMEKAGMLREGILRRYILHPNVSPEPRDVFIYAKTR